MLGSDVREGLHRLVLMELRALAVISCRRASTHTQGIEQGGCTSFNNTGGIKGKASIESEALAQR